MDHDLLIAYGPQVLLEALSIILLVTIIGVLLLIKRDFEGSFFGESIVLFILLIAGAITLLLLATNLAAPE